MRPRRNKAKRARRITLIILLLAIVLVLVYKNTASNGSNASNELAPGQGNVTEPAIASADPSTDASAPAVSDEPTPSVAPSSDSSASTSAPGTNEPASPSTSASGSVSTTSNSGSSSGQHDVAALTDPASTAVLVNKQYGLPETYDPQDLVYPNVSFTFSEKIEKRMMRKVAAEALEKMFAGAKQDGIYLAGVSAYRSYERQTEVFNSYVKRDGEVKASTYSAYPGHSEHETGLAIDVSGSDGKCAAEDCFGGTKEAKWIADHAAEYGFIVRYPEGKEAITGYKYEPWHIRYVGTEIAENIAKRGITLEEYYDAIPVSK